MRDIIFRAWDVKNNEMVNDVNLNDGKPVKKGYQWFNTENTVHRSKLQQHTGLNDKDDMGIYEGDIIKHKYYDGFQEVFYSDSLLAYRLSPADVFIQRVDEDMGLIEIVGNIYEDVDLIKSVENRNK